MPVPRPERGLGFQPKSLRVGGTPRYQGSERDGRCPWHTRHGQNARATLGMPGPRPERGLGFQPESLRVGGTPRYQCPERDGRCPWHTRHGQNARATLGMPGPRLERGLGFQPKSLRVGGTPRYQGSERDGRCPWHTRHGQNARATSDCPGPTKLMRYRRPDQGGVGGSWARILRAVSFPGRSCWKASNWARASARRAGRLSRATPRLKCASA